MSLRFAFFLMIALPSAFVGELATLPTAASAAATARAPGAAVAKAAHAAASPGPPQPLGPGLISDFAGGAPSSPFGEWHATTDTLLGGASSVMLSVTPAGTLALSGETKPNDLAVWAGAGLGFSGDWSQLRDLSGVRDLVFRARGAPGNFRVFFFGPARDAPPIERPFTIGRDWTEIRITLAKVDWLDPKALRAIAIVAGPQIGPYSIEIDDVRLE